METKPKIKALHEISRVQSRGEFMPRLICPSCNRAEACTIEHTSHSPCVGCGTAYDPETWREGNVRIVETVEIVQEEAILEPAIKESLDISATWDKDGNMVDFKKTAILDGKVVPDEGLAETEEAPDAGPTV